MDFDVVLGELKRTAYVGVGTFASASVGNMLEDRVPGGNLGVASAQTLVGAAAAVASEEYLAGRGDAMSNSGGLAFRADEAVRHFGYGVGGAGFAEAAESVTADSGGSGQLMEVRARESRPQRISMDTDGGVNQSQSVSSADNNNRDRISVDI